MKGLKLVSVLFFFQAEDGIRDTSVTGVQTCALPICFRGKNRQILPAKCCFRPLSRPLPDPAKGLYCRVASGGRKNILARSAVLRIQLRTETNSIRKPPQTTDRKSTRLNSSHRCISYA